MKFAYNNYNNTYMKLQQFQKLELQFQVKLKKLQPLGLIALTSDEQWDFSNITYCIVMATKEDYEKVAIYLFEQIILFNMLLPEIDYLREGNKFKFI